MTADLVWKSIPLLSRELSLARVLRCGQTFRWKNVNNVWSFSTKDKIILLKQDDEVLHYAAIGSTKLCHADYEAVFAFITDYFNLEVKLDELYKTWAEIEARHSRNSKAASFLCFPGIRILRQDPWETVVSFICSSNNNVKRISKMCDALCTEYGNYINDLDGVAYYSFPGPDVLAHPSVEGRLRELGFGYRAKYIQQTASMFVDPEVKDVSMDALHAQRVESYEDAHQFLLRLTGVGPKVADCICLMALDKHDVVPVDTHVLQIAVRDYRFKGPKTMTSKSYHLVRNHLRSLFGEYAGWAQSVLFAADLSDLNNGVNQVNGEAIKHEVKEEVAGTQGVSSADKINGQSLKVEQIDVSLTTTGDSRGKKRRLTSKQMAQEIKSVA